MPKNIGFDSLKISIIFISFCKIWPANSGILTNDPTLADVFGAIRQLNEEVIVGIDEKMECKKHLEETIAPSNNIMEQLKFQNGHEIVQKICQLNKEIGEKFSEILGFNQKGISKEEEEQILATILQIRKLAKEKMEETEKIVRRKLTSKEEKEIRRAVKKDYDGNISKWARKKLEKHLEKMLSNGKIKNELSHEKMKYLLELMLVIKKIEDLDEKNAFGRLLLDIGSIASMLTGLAILIVSIPLFPIAKILGLCFGYCYAAFCL